MLKDIINIILKMHIPFPPLCNLHFDINYVLQFTMEYIMCVCIFEKKEKEFDAHKIWQC